MLVELEEDEMVGRGCTLELLLPEYEAEDEMSCSYKESGCQLVVEDSEERWVDDVVTRCKYGGGLNDDSTTCSEGRGAWE